MDEKKIRDLMNRAGFTWIQRDSVYNRERVERLVTIVRKEAAILTPDEFWDMAPWNYDMDSAPKNTNPAAKWEDKTHIMLKDKNNNIQVSYWALCDDYVLGGYWVDLYSNFEPIAWLLLPETMK